MTDLERIERASRGSAIIAGVDTLHRGDYRITTTMSLWDGEQVVVYVRKGDISLDGRVTLTDFGQTIASTSDWFREGDPFDLIDDVAEKVALLATVKGAHLKRTCRLDLLPYGVRRLASACQVASKFLAEQAGMKVF